MNREERGSTNLGTASGILFSQGTRALTNSECHCGPTILPKHNLRCSSALLRYLTPHMPQRGMPLLVMSQPFNADVGRCKTNLVKWVYSENDDTICLCHVRRGADKYATACPPLPDPCAQEGLEALTPCAINAMQPALDWDTLIKDLGPFSIQE